MDKAEVERLSAELEDRSPQDVLAWAYDRFGARCGVSTAFGASGSVLIDMIHELGRAPNAFTLDTRRLFPETLAFKADLERWYGIVIKSYGPAITDEAIDAAYGRDLTLQNPDQCCYVRKVEPMRRAVADLDCWVSGVRRDQGPTRAASPILQQIVLDSGRAIVKCHPLARWTRKEVWRYLFEHKVPYHPLLDQGYGSVGCAPCTTPIGVGEGERDGRWRGTGKTECGIHVSLSEPKR